MLMNYSTTIHAVLMAFAIALAAQSGAPGQTTVPEWRRHSSLPTAMTGHRMALLPTGDVLICGGIDGNGDVGRFSWLYSSATGTVRPTINQLNTPRALHALVPITTAGVTRVFAIGGYGGTTGNYRGESSIEALEFDATANNWRWRPVGSLSVGRGDLRASWDGMNHLVVTGGYQNTGGALRSGQRSPVAERIDLATLAVQTLPSMDAARAEHASAHIIDENGNDVVLVAGGEANIATTTTQILENGAWNPIANPPLVYRSGGLGFGDMVGIARTFGGFDGSGVPGDACEWYDVKRGWRSAPRMNQARARFAMTPIAGLNDTARAYLAVAGTGAASTLTSTEIFFLPNSSFPNGSWTPFPSLVQPGSERMTVIGGGNLPIVAGGIDGAETRDGIEVFQPLRAGDVAFSDEEVGRRSDSVQLSITNEWLLPVTVRNFRMGGSPSFFFRGDTSSFVLRPGTSRTIRLYFQPGSTGRHDGSLLFDVGELTDTVKLTGNGIASTLSVINSPFDVGAVFIRSSRQVCFHALRNNGTDTAVIDSIVVEPSGAFRLISPKGRASIPPGDSLRVCIEFAPQAQGDFSGVATIHLASRAFPAQIIGKGVRRFMTASVITAECDTVIYAPGATISGFIRIANPGDSDVIMTLPVLTQGVAGFFSLADSSLYPLTLAPGESRLIEIVFAPSRESRENVTVTFPNNGDTAATATLCFIARSRFLSVSQPSLDFGGVCVGDTITQTLLLENPGGFDQVTLVAATINPSAQLSFDGFAPGTLGPREYRRITVTFIPDAPGVVNGSLTIGNDRGDVTIPITGEGLASARFTPADVRIAIGETLTVPVHFDDQGIGATITRATLSLSYDPTLLAPLRILPSTSGPQLDPTASQLRILGGGRAQLDLVWTGAGLIASGPAFGLEIEALRGDALLASLTLRGETGNGFCTEATQGRVDFLPPCWGESGSIRSAKASFVFVWPSPAAQAANIMAVSPLDGAVTIDVVRMNGQTIGEYESTERDGNTRMLTISTENMPNGFYLIRARVAGRIVGTTTLAVSR